MNTHSISTVGWLIGAVFTFSSSIVFWLGWTIMNVGEKYFYFLPDVYQNLGFWECFWLFTCIGILKSVIVPKFVSVEQNNSNKE